MKRSLIVLIIVMYGCSSTEQYRIMMEEGGTKVVTGPFDRTLLEHDSDFKSWFDFRYDEYDIDSTWLPAIAEKSKETRYLIIAGTWCGDSKREIPHFLKILDAAGIAHDQVAFHGVDRSKKSAGESLGHYMIDRVPTIIVLREGSEIGRIVEHPEESLEEDLVKILSSK